MNELTVYQQSGLPAQPSDLAKFILIMPEKIKAMKAEIMAIQKAQLAKEVYDQKKDELDRVRELMLLAYFRMGEITREIPTSVGGRPNEKTLPSCGKSFEKTKSQAIKDLGLSTSQVGRMEQMAAHPDIVEEVIAESQAGQTEATQGEVLRRIKEQKTKVIDLDEARKDKFHAEMEQIDRDTKNLNQFMKVTCFIDGLYEITPEILDSVVVADSDLNWTLKKLEEATQLLITIRNMLQERRARRGNKALYERD